MKIRLFVFNLLIALLIVIALSSCNDAPDGSLDLDLDKYTQNLESVSNEEYLSSVGNTWLSPEAVYHFDPTHDSIQGIQKLEAGNLAMNQTHMNKIYFTTTGEQGLLYMYLDPTTGEVFDLCPDPLCSHTDRDQCPYMTVIHLVPDNSIENGKLYIAHDVIFDEGYSTYCVISEITENGTLRRVYGDRNKKTEEGYTVKNSLSEFCVYNNYICFTERYDYLSSGSTVETKRYFRVIDGDTGEMLFTCDRDEFSGNLIHITANNLLFVDYANQYYYITDLQMNNKQIIFTFADTASITYDANTEEYFVYTTEIDETGNQVSSIYVYDKNWNGYKLEMPSSQITYAVITQNYIYYEKYHDPVVYGTSIRDNMQTTDTTGDKIFRVRRTNGDVTSVSEEELIFDGHDEIFHYGFNVLGDYLYIKFKELHYEGDYVWWRVTGDVARIHLTENTIKWINLQ